MYGVRFVVSVELKIITPNTDTHDDDALDAVI